MKNKNILTILFLMLVLTVISCGNSNKKSDRIDAVEKEVCGEYLAQQLEKFGAKVYNQRADLIAWDGTILKARNIIGAYKPESKKRIMLCAHWDSRPYADNDPDPKNHHTHILGVNDGASGVGVLLEIARQIQQKEPALGMMRKTTERRNFIQDNPNRIHGVWGHSSGHALPTYRIIMPATEFCLIW